MHASARLRLGPTSRSGSDPGRAARIVDARCEPPYAVRRAAGRILVAASAAGPLGGDDLELAIDVEPDTDADVGSVGAAMVLPGTTGATSSSRTSVAVGARSHVRWWPEPTISVSGSDHDLRTTIRLDTDATCTIVEEVALGRSDEPAGLLRASLRVERDGRVVVHHAESFGPSVAGAASVVSVGRSRHVLTAVLVGDDARGLGSETLVPRRPGHSATFAARLAVEVDAAAILVAADDRPAALDAAARLGLVHPSRSAPRISRSTDRTTVDVLV